MDGKRGGDHVVDTGGEVISISRATAVAIGRSEPKRRIALKVFGSSGWDTDAFLLPGVDLRFDTIRYGWDEGNPLSGAKATSSQTT